MTNVTNLHTFTTNCVDLVLAAVFLLHGHLLELVGDVVGGAAVDIPVGVDAVGAICSRRHLVIILRGVVILFMAVPAIFCCVPQLATYLAPRGIRSMARIAATAASSVVGGSTPAIAGVGAAAVSSSPGPPPATGEAATPRGATTTTRGRVRRGLEAAAAVAVKSAIRWSKFDSIAKSSSKVTGVSRASSAEIWGW